MKSKSVLIDLSVLMQSTSGVPIYAQNLADELLKIENSPFNFRFVSSGEIPKFKDFYKAVTFKNKSSYKRIFWENVFMARHINSDIYHNPLFLLPRFGLKKQIATVITVHDLAFIEHPESFDFKTRLYFRLFLRKSLERADIVIAISNATAESISNYFPAVKNKVRVIYNGFNDFRRLSQLENICKYKTPYFLQVGCGHKRKNLDVTIEGFLKIKCNRNLRLICVGTSQRQKSSYKDVPGIVFLDQISEEDLYDLYRNAIATMYPSQYEGFGFPILEAMSSGCPVICSNIPSSREISDYKSQDMFALGDMNKLVSLMEDMLNNSERRLAFIEHGYKRVDEFSWEKMAHQVHDLYMSFK